MPSLNEHQSSKTTKMILIGDPGAGKTGSLASLANAGYRLRILDFDNGLDVLKNLLTDPKSPYKKEAAQNVIYQTLTDEMKKIGGRMAPKGKNWSKAIEQLDHWKTPSEDLGPVASWTDQDVLVIDSLTLMSEAALNFTLGLNGRLGQKPYQEDWGAAQTLVKGVVETLYDDEIRCNVIVCSHITYIGEEGAVPHGYPMTVGKKLSERIGRYFNNIAMIKSTGSGSQVRRKIHTTTVSMVELKNAAPMRVEKEYDIVDGMARYFKDLRGE